MKKLCVLFLTFVLFSCSVIDAIGPDLSAKVKGVYQVYLVGDGVTNVNMPSGGKSISIELTSIDKKTSSYIIKLSSGGNVDTQEGIFELKKSGDQTDLYQDDKKIGFINGNELDIDYSDSNGLRSVMKARK
ncbi:hypothetical protein [Emticicia sp. BO119]|uniref:hypothetical protein n=1 Tax=Emticicia sp. BO119 TaxID=2757768 RepID=UPI0015F0255B|nr:hypothetical protein [Emticicia sp. BO119]MBA4849364.1 hypothetical protein [Emticicia sp. BO119]